jgi:hypothetical protein
MVGSEVRSGVAPVAGGRDVAGGPALPAARGPLSAAVRTALAGPPAGRWTGPLPGPADDPYGDDLQLALYLCYELHYRGFAGVDPDWEWDTGLIGFRQRLESAFLAVVRSEVPRHDGVPAALEGLLVEPIDGTGLSHYLRDEGGWREMRENTALRSTYHLKEADPHAFVIPRLDGAAKAALVAVEFDEFGGGRPDRMHSRLFADLMAGMGLATRYGAYLDATPAPMLAIVNLMTLFGVHRSLRGALVGHFAAAEISTAPSARRMAQALRRLGAPEPCVFFYTEHIEADAVHEQVMRHEVIGDLLDRHPELTDDVILGISGTVLLEDRLGGRGRGAWRDGRSALREPLEPWQPPAAGGDR